MTIHPCILDPENRCHNEDFGGAIALVAKVSAHSLTSFRERKRRSEASTFGKDLALAIKLDKQEEKGVPPFKQEVEILERF